MGLLSRARYCAQWRSALAPSGSCDVAAPMEHAFTPFIYKQSQPFAHPLAQARRRAMLR